MLIKNTTIQNRSKQPRLGSEHTIPTQNIQSPQTVQFLQSLAKIQAPKEVIIYSLGCHLLKGNRNPAVRDFLCAYPYDRIQIPGIPRDEFDLLGSAYQYLNSKIENLEKGSFYTGKDIALDFVRDLDFSAGQTLCYPSCVSGSFLFYADAPAAQIYGVDNDPLAIMIAKFNYFIKFPTAPAPHLYCADFFAWYREHQNLQFDYIIGNPPYGANIDISHIPSTYIRSGESFSYFIEYGFRLLKPRGIFRYLLPEAILNVKRHTDIRDFILTQTNLNRIKRYAKKFPGIMSDVYLLELDRRHSRRMTFANGTSTTIPKALFLNFKNHLFVHLTTEDINILNKVISHKKYDLSTSLFGLGVVTGDNKKKILDAPAPTAEPIYTGKEVAKYALLPPRHYLVFDRRRLQQVAPDEIYRAPQKLVYKTINKYLKVALDTTGALTSNSANIIIPRLPELDIYTILSLLNSDLYSYLHLKLFGGVNKVAKENLMALPLPAVSKMQQKQLRRYVKDAIRTHDDHVLQDYVHTAIFELTPTEINYLRSQIKPLRASKQ